MPMDRSSCYRALRARDARFDGAFFVGVTSTGIYCRPVCRSKTPRVANCRFFSNAAAAERSGFRPCLRCRPELAPGNAPVDATRALADQAVRAITDGALTGHSIETLAQRFGVTSRHLRRAVTERLGVAPIELATTQRLLLAKRLLHESSLPVGQIAFAAGFESLRRFNAAFKQHYRLNPAALRRAAADSDMPVEADGAIELTLAYRSPIHWDALMTFLAARATPGVEYVESSRYAATVRLPGAPRAADGAAPRGRIVLSEVVGDVLVERRVAGARGQRTARANHEVVVRVSPSLVTALMPLLARVRDVLDLDANPDVIARHLAKAGLLAKPAQLAGVRIPGALDPFALAVRAILGQQVSVKGATTVMGRLVAAFGTPYAGGDPRLTRLMPTPHAIARLRTGDLATLGMPGKRADAVIALARGVVDGTLDLSPGADPARACAALTALPGVGDWTAHYIAMRALRWPDAFPANDLVLRRAAGNLTAAQLLKRAEAWRPWRGYAAMHLWRTVPASPSRKKTNDRD